MNIDNEKIDLDKQIENKKHDYILAHQKNPLLGLILTVIFGPLGLFYSSWVAGLLLLSLAVIGFNEEIIPLMVWLISVPISVITIKLHNNKIKERIDILLLIDKEMRVNR